jgi:hypothetical protein
MMVLLIGLHSLLEYPLWYAYFLLPTAFASGLALGLPAAAAGAAPSAAPAPAAPRPPWLRAAAGVLCVAGALLALFDYLRVAEIFAARRGAAPLEQRIEAGKHSLFFAHHAHYAAATVSDTPAQELSSFNIATHHLLDTRLMMAWAQAYAQAGDLERARHLAQRLREFRNPASAEFLAVCDAPRGPPSGGAGGPAADRAPGAGGDTATEKPSAAGSALPLLPFQCVPPARLLTWRDFLSPAP